jgi:hypothetical protein
MTLLADFVGTSGQRWEGCGKVAKRTAKRNNLMMIDHLQNVLPYLENLPPEAQEEAATYIAALAEALEFESLMSGHKRPARRKIEAEEPWEDPAGAWRDLPDTLLEDLDNLRHSSPPTPPIDLSVADGKRVFAALEN